MGVLQVQVEVLYLRAGEQSLVNHRVGGEAGDVEVIRSLHAGSGHSALYHFAYDVQLPFQGGLIKDVGAAPHKELPYDGPHRPCRLANVAFIHGDVPPSQEPLAFRLDNVPSMISSQRVLSSTWPCGKNAIPTPYSSRCGRSAPLSWTRNECGVWRSIPAPSPVSGSLPSAPRCARCRSMSMPQSIIWRDLRPLISATTPTPQASCSNSGRYSPSRFVFSHQCVPQSTGRYRLIS